MATLKQLRGRIKAAKNIRQITRAMKLVAAARFKKATDRVLEARPYSDKIREFMMSLSMAGELPPHPLMENRGGSDFGLILITGERGLCGSFNTALLRKAEDFVKEASGTCSLITVGKKGTQYFGKRGYNVAHSVTLPSAGANYEIAQEVATVARTMFESGKIDRVFVCYSKFYSAIRQVPTIVQLLPIEAPETDEAQSSGLEFAFEPNAAGLLEQILPRYFMTLVWQALLENTASEFGARMTAMTSATDNAGKMIHELTLKANRERQATITKEILEVVGGAEALKN